MHFMSVFRYHITSFYLPKNFVLYVVLLYVVVIFIFIAAFIKEDIMMVKLFFLIVSLFLSGFSTGTPLTVEVFNPGENSVTQVSSELVYGESEAVLFDAQFDTVNGKKLVDLIQKRGKKLTMIYISGGDPDYYFGLEPILDAFPDVKVLASPAVVNHINKTKDMKIAYWGPILGSAAPKKIIVPDVYEQDKFLIDGSSVEVKLFNTANSFVWIPSLKTALGGELVTYGRHPWMADTPTKAERIEWVDALNSMLSLKPERVIPGHYDLYVPDGVKAVLFTRDYIVRFEQELIVAKNSGKLIDAMKLSYPDLPITRSLELGAKVAMGEMKWQ